MNSNSKSCCGGARAGWSGLFEKKPILQALEEANSQIEEGQIANQLELFMS